MADFYGKAGENPFTLKGIGGVLSTVTNAGNGVTEIYRQGPLTTQQSLGTYNPSSGKFTPNANAGLTDNEIRALSSDDSIKNIKNKSSEVVKKSLVGEGLSPESAQIKANQITSPNSANNLPTAEEVQTTVSNLDIEARKGTRESYPKNLRYPEDLENSKQDVIKFTMLKYEPRSFTSDSQSIAGFSERNMNRTGIGNVILPIPGGITDTNSVSWGEDRMTPAQAAFASIALSGITKGLESAVNTATTQLQGLINNADDAKAAIAAGFAEQATGVSGLLARTGGVVINPNMELLFQSPSLRPFNFTFKLSARSEKDRDQIRQIIRFFKQGMSVQRTESNLFLKAPNTFKIQYLHRRTDRDHPYLNRIKECALQSFTVNYTPEGNYMTFSDGLMTSYEISMQFQELEPVFNDDYSGLPGGNSDTEIGY